MVPEEVFHPASGAWLDCAACQPLPALLGVDQVVPYALGGSGQHPLDPDRPPRERLAEPFFVHASHVPFSFLPGVAFASSSARSSASSVSRLLVQNRS